MYQLIDNVSGLVGIGLGLLVLGAAVLGVLIVLGVIDISGGPMVDCPIVDDLTGEVLDMGVCDDRVPAVDPY